jgi:hypothetical protein
LGLLSVDLIYLKILLHKMTFVPGIVTLLSGVADSELGQSVRSWERLHVQ